jgi:hypothetical protein
MRPFIRPIALAVSLASLAALGVAGSGDALAQAKQAPKKEAAPATQTAPAPAEAAALKQIALTDKQIEQVLAAQKDFDAILAKVPEKPGAKPDPKITAQLEDAAKKYGFASYDEYGDVIDNISLVLGGIDPQSKTYVGPEALIKSQIAAVEADKKISAKEKKAALAELNEALKSPQPTVENKGNIDLVTKNYDKLSEALSEDEE